MIHTLSKLRWFSCALCAVHRIIVYCLWYRIGSVKCMVGWLVGWLNECKRNGSIDRSNDRTINRAHSHKHTRLEARQMRTVRSTHIGNGCLQQQNSHQIYLNISTIHALQKRSRRRPFTEFHDSTPFNRRSIAVNYILGWSFCMCECGELGAKCVHYILYFQKGQTKREWMKNTLCEEKQQTKFKFSGHFEWWWKECKMKWIKNGMEWNGMENAHSHTNASTNTFQLAVRCIYRWFLRSK